jgi:hypothetical protein
MRKTLMLITGLGLLAAGCAKPLEVASITEIKAPPGAQGVDVYAARRQSGEKVPDFAGDQIVEVRTYAETEGGGTGDEFAGARCQVKARDFSADLVSPGKVRVPVYRAQSSQLAVQCQKDGFKPRLVDIGAYNVTKAERMQAGGNAGVVGVLFMAAVNAASDETTHDFRYPHLRVVMTPNTFATAKKD